MGRGSPCRGGPAAGEAQGALQASLARNREPSIGLMAFNANRIRWIAIAVACSLCTAATAAAAPVLVMGKDGQVRTHRALARARHHVPGGRRARSPRGPRCAEPRARARRPSRGVLKDLRASGRDRRRRPTPSAAPPTSDAKQTVKKLKGARKLELRRGRQDARGRRRARAAHRVAPGPAVPHARSATASGGPNGPLLTSGRRVGFEGSQIVWQYYPGAGIQIQVLGTFGKVNALWSSRQNTALGAAVDELLPLAAERAGGLAWEYYFPYGAGKAPWVSCLAQGTALQALSRAATRLNRARAGLPRHQPGADHLRDGRARGRARARGRGSALRAVLLRARAADPQRLRPVARRPLRLRPPGGRRPRQGAVRRRASCARARRCRPTTPAPGRCTRAGRSRTSPTSATTRSCATSSSSLCNRTDSPVYCGAEDALHRLPVDRRRCSSSGPRGCAAARYGAHPHGARQDLRRHAADHARGLGSCTRATSARSPAARTRSAGRSRASAGTYTVELIARDLAGNPARSRARSRCSSRRRRRSASRSN